MSLDCTSIGGLCDDGTNQLLSTFGFYHFFVDSENGGKS